MARREIIAIGGSAGSIAVIRQICRALPADLHATVLIAVHVGASNQNLLAGILDSSGPLPASTAVDGEPLQKSHIYVAPTDHHLLVDGPFVRLGRGPRKIWRGLLLILYFGRSGSALDPWRLAFCFRGCLMMGLPDWLISSVAEV
ncbi:hypothetical protein K2E96_03800 [Pseudomonas sp. ERGC3:05]|nr:hypothetical protein K2E96_03800 [Pseudomonas sp. ERGC3:05]